MTTKQVIFLSLLAAVILGFTTSWYFKKLTKSLSEADLPNFEIPEFNPFSSQETKDYIEFISPNGKLKLKYPSQWLRMETDTLEGFNQALIDEKANNLLFTQGFKIEKGELIFLMVQELTLEEKTGLEEIIETIKERVKEQGGEIEVSNLKIEDNTAYFEGRFKGETSTTLYSKEKIILTDSKAYLVILFNLTNNWSQFEEEVNEVLNSVELLS